MAETALVVERGDVLGEPYRRRITEVYVRSFAEDFVAFSRDTDRLADAFEHMLLLERFYVVLVDGEPAGLASFTEGDQELFAPRLRQLLRHLGPVRGLLGHVVIRSWFMGASDGARPGLAEIGFVATEPAYQGRGVATALLRHLLALPGHHEYVLEDIKDTNAPALGLYAKLGFTVYKRQPVRHARRVGFAIAAAVSLVPPGLPTSRRCGTARESRRREGPQADELHPVLAVVAGLQGQVAVEPDEVVGRGPDLRGVPDVDDLVDLVAALDAKVLPGLPGQDGVAAAGVVRCPHRRDVVVLVRRHLGERAVAPVELGYAARDAEPHGRYLPGDSFAGGVDHRVGGGLHRPVGTLDRLRCDEVPHGECPTGSDQEPSGEADDGLAPPPGRAACVPPARHQSRRGECHGLIMPSSRLSRIVDQVPVTPAGAFSVIPA
ncbi:hypothetical protein GCM10027063_17790 [Promicromonospora xylanilytica]